MFPAHREETYALPADDLYLAGTAEVALVGFHSTEILDHRSLPIRYAGISPCFRREAGSAGRGCARAAPGPPVREGRAVRHLRGRRGRVRPRARGTCSSPPSSLLQGLGLAYEVMEVSTGDMGAGKYRMNDLNTWMPSLSAYRETHSCSSLHDWQAGGPTCAYRDTDGTVRYAYTLNTPR